MATVVTLSDACRMVAGLAWSQWPLQRPNSTKDTTTMIKSPITGQHRDTPPTLADVTAGLTIKQLIAYKATVLAYPDHADDRPGAREDLVDMLDHLIERRRMTGAKPTRTDKLNAAQTVLHAEAWLEGLELAGEAV